MASSQQGIPRKFSEKIAILERKQNEEEQQFHNVMRDVRALTSKAGGVPPPQMNSPTGIYTSQSSAPNSMQRRCHAPPSQLDEEGYGNGGGVGGGPPQAFIVGAPPHPLLPMQWNRSLPNVHQSLATNPNEVDFNNWNQWQSGGGAPAQHQARTRSPGSSHAYHPYSHPARAVAVGTSSAGGSPRQGGQLCSESHIQMMMMPSSIHHLQLPDPTWSKARLVGGIGVVLVVVIAAVYVNVAMFRSDPTININSMAATTSTMMMPVPPGCFNSSTPHMQPPQQQQWSAPQQQQQTPLTSPIVVDYPMFNGSVMSPSRAAVPYPVPAVAHQQQSPPFQYPPSTSYRTYQSQQDGILSQYPAKCYPVIPKGQRGEASIPELDNRPLDISMGSLPNMHAQVPYDGEINTPPMSAADRYRDSRSPSQPMPVELFGQATWTMDEAVVRINHQQQQQQQQSQVQQQQPQPQGMRTGSLCQPSSSQQLSTPMLGPQSQSAPTSPSLTTMDGPLLSHHQWPPNRHFSASPTSPDALDIPNIVLTGPGGTLDGANFDCFHDLKDLHIDHLDNEIQVLVWMELMVLNDVKKKQRATHAFSAYSPIPARVPSTPQLSSSSTETLLWW